MKYKKILITGANGMVGKNLVPYMKNIGYDIVAPHRKTYRLDNYEDVYYMVHDNKPEAIIHLAANCGGIGLNQQKPADLFYDNCIMGINLIKNCIGKSIKILNLSTICAYPKNPPHIPFIETDLWMGYPEETNSKYSMAKKAVMEYGNAARQQHGLNFITLMPCNMYGKFDHFEDKAGAHVIPMLISRVQDAIDNKLNVIECWGTGKATREFLFVEDACDAIVKALEYYDDEIPVNIAGGEEISINDLLFNITKIMNYSGDVIYNTNKPDGQPRRILDGTLAWKRFAYKPKTTLYDGLKKTISWYREKIAQQ